MAKRIRTPEQVEADIARMAAMRAKRGQNKNPQKQNEKEVKQIINEAPKLALGITEGFAPGMTIPLKEEADTISHDDYIDLLKQIQELKELHWKDQLENSREANREANRETGRVQLQGGRLIGTVDKYDLTPNIYPSPVERLTREPRLARFAFEQNYVLDFSVAISEYTTIDNIRTREPKFTLVLAAYMYDDETGEQVFNEDGSPQAYVVRRLIMHEDPEAALVIARDNDLEVDEEDEVAFLNEMRYIRMRDFLLECYYPTKPKDNRMKKEIVVGGKIVETFQVTSEGDRKPKINFDLIKDRKL